MHLFERWALAWLARGTEVGPDVAARASLAAVERGRAQALLDLLRDSRRAAGRADAADGIRCTGRRSRGGGRSTRGRVSQTAKALLTFLSTQDTLDPAWLDRSARWCHRCPERGVAGLHRRAGVRPSRGARGGRRGDRHTGRDAWVAPARAAAHESRPDGAHVSARTPVRRASRRSACRAADSGGARRALADVGRARHCRTGPARASPVCDASPRPTNTLAFRLSAAVSPFVMHHPWPPWPSPSGARRRSPRVRRRRCVPR